MIFAGSIKRLKSLKNPQNSGRAERYDTPSIFVINFKIISLNIEIHTNRAYNLFPYCYISRPSPFISLLLFRMSTLFPLKSAILITRCLKPRVSLRSGRSDGSRILVFKCSFSPSCVTRAKPKRTTKSLVLLTDRSKTPRMESEASRGTDLTSSLFFATVMDQDRKTPPFVGQALVKGPEILERNISAPSSPWNLQLPDRSIGMQFQQVQTAHTQLPGNSDESNKRKPQSDEGSIGHIDFSVKAKKKKPKTRKTPKEHDRGVWQVPDVAFTQDESGVAGAPSNESIIEKNTSNNNVQAPNVQVPNKSSSAQVMGATSNDLWAEFKAKALASARKSNESGKQNSTDKGNDQASTTQAQKAHPTLSKKARKRLNKMNRENSLANANSLNSSNQNASNQTSGDATGVGSFGRAREETTSYRTTRQEPSRQETTCKRSSQRLDRFAHQRQKYSKTPKPAIWCST